MTEKDDKKQFDEKDKKKARADKKKAAKVRKADKGKGKEPADDRFLRLQADFENFRKRVIREKSDIYKRANEDMMEELLPVLDHMDLALDAVAEHNAEDAFVEGVRLVSEQLNVALKKHGLEPIDADGLAFDPNIHEAVAYLPSEDVEENMVITQVRRGYSLGEKVLRAAQVVVSRGGDKDGDDEGLL